MDPFEIFPLEITYKILKFCVKEWSRIYKIIKEEKEINNINYNDINNILNHISPLNRLNNLYKNLPLVCHLWRHIIINFGRSNSFKKSIYIESILLRKKFPISEKMLSYLDQNKIDKFSINFYFKVYHFNINSDFIFQSNVNKNISPSILIYNNYWGLLRGRDIKIKGELTTYEIDIIYYFNDKQISVFFNIKNINIINKFVFKIESIDEILEAKMKINNILYSEIDINYISSKIQKKEVKKINKKLWYYLTDNKHDFQMEDEILFLSNEIFKDISISIDNFTYYRFNVTKSITDMLFRNKVLLKMNFQSNFGIFLDNILKGFV